MPDALWWDTGDPYHYLRVEPHRDYDLVIFGGEDHKTGQVDGHRGVLHAARGELQAMIPDVELKHRWSGQVIETHDGLPYIGSTADASVRRDRLRWQRPDVRDAGWRS